jgi:NagD protein
LPGAKEFVDWLHINNKRYLFLTNSSERSPLELRQKLLRLGLDVSEEHFYTSALATASFIATQSPGSSAYVIGAPGLINALYDAGITTNDVNPDYVIIGETSNYNYDSIVRAVRFVNNGARLIGTNPDMTGPSELGILPACRALVAPVELATGKSAYFIGKPNPLMMRHAMRILSLEIEDTAIIGDRMDTDIIAGIESGIDTVLVMSGVTNSENIKQFSYRPCVIIDDIGGIAEK